MRAGYFKIEWLRLAWLILRSGLSGPWALSSSTAPPQFPM